MENYQSRREFLNNLRKLGGVAIASTIPSFITGCGNSKEYEVQIMQGNSAEKAEPVKLEISPIEVLVDEYSTKLSAGTLNKTPVAFGIVNNELYCIENPTDLFQKLDDSLYLDGDAVILGILQNTPVRKRSSSKSGQVQINDNVVFNPVYLEDKIIEIRTGNKNIGYRSRKIPAVKITNQDCSENVTYAFFTIPGGKSTLGSLYAVEEPSFDVDGKNSTLTLNNKCKRIIVKGEGAEYKPLKVYLGSIPSKEEKNEKNNSKDSEKAEEDVSSEPHNPKE